jgi:hypothetical protein
MLRIVYWTDGWFIRTRYEEYSQHAYRFKLEKISLNDTITPGEYCSAYGTSGKKGTNNMG